MRNSGVCLTGLQGAIPHRAGKGGPKCGLVNSWAVLLQPVCIVASSLIFLCPPAFVYSREMSEVEWFSIHFLKLCLSLSYLLSIVCKSLCNALFSVCDSFNNFLVSLKAAPHIIWV